MWYNRSKASELGKILILFAFFGLFTTFSENAVKLKMAYLLG